MKNPPCFFIGLLLMALGSMAYAAKEGSPLSPQADWLNQLKDPAHRIDAQWNLRLEKDPQKIPQLLKLLGSDDRDLKVTALQILSESGDSGLWKQITPLLKEKDPAVREAAAHALGSLGDLGALPFLIEIFQQGMNLSDTAAYWLIPSDITDNDRYACVEAINRLAKQDFKYTRSLNNFGRMFWAAKIGKWWKQQQVFYLPSFRQQAGVWKECKGQIEAILAGLPKSLLEGSHGVEEFDGKLRELKEYVEALIRTIESPGVSAGELKEHLGEVAKTLLAVDEIFVYTPELAISQGAWVELTTKLGASRKSLESFLSPK